MTRKRRIKCITFDLDDTLWACAPVILQAEQALYDWLAARYPLITNTYTLEDMREQRKSLLAKRDDLHHDMTQLRREWIGQLAQEFDYPEEMVEPSVTFFRKHRNQVSLFEEALPLLKALREIYTLGAITNGNAQLDEAGVAHLFDFVIYSADVGATKPDGRIFYAALRRADAKPEETIHVGDDPRTDVLGASRAGLGTVWINPGKKPWSGDGAPDAVIHSLEELHDVLDQLEGGW